MLGGFETFLTIGNMIDCDITKRWESRPAWPSGMILGTNASLTENSGSIPAGMFNTQYIPTIYVY